MLTLTQLSVYLYRIIAGDAVYELTMKRTYLIMSISMGLYLMSLLLFSLFFCLPKKKEDQKNEEENEERQKLIN